MMTDTIVLLIYNSVLIPFNNMIPVLLSFISLTVGRVFFHIDTSSGRSISIKNNVS